MKIIAVFFRTKFRSGQGGSLYDTPVMVHLRLELRSHALSKHIEQYLYDAEYRDAADEIASAILHHLTRPREEDIHELSERCPNKVAYADHRTACLLHDPGKIYDLLVHAGLRHHYRKIVLL